MHFTLTKSMPFIPPALCALLFVQYCVKDIKIHSIAGFFYFLQYLYILSIHTGKSV